MGLTHAIIFIQCFLWAFLLFSKPRQKKDMALGFFLSDIGFIYFLDYLSSTYNLPPNIFYYTLLVILLFSLHPILIKWFGFLTKTELPLDKYIIHLLIPFIVVLTWLFEVLIIKEDTISINFVFLEFETFLFILSTVYLLHYVFLFRKYYKQGNYTDTFWKDKTSQFFIITGSGIILVSITGILENYILFPGVAIVWKAFPIAICIFLIAFISIKSKTTVQTVDRKKQLLKEFDHHSIDSLIQHIEKEKPYIDCDLSLEKLSDQIHIQPADLTKLLNEGMGLSFYQLINKYRVKEFKELVKSSKMKEFTILALGFESGFNSKSTFYRVFKEFEGLSPAQYAKNEKMN